MFNGTYYYFHMQPEQELINLNKVCFMGLIITSTCNIFTFWTYLEFKQTSMSQVIKVLPRLFEGPHASRPSKLKKYMFIYMHLVYKLNKNASKQ